MAELLALFAFERFVIAAGADQKVSAQRAQVLTASGTAWQTIKRRCAERQGNRPVRRRDTPPFPSMVSAPEY